MIRRKLPTFGTLLLLMFVCLPLYGRKGANLLSIKRGESGNRSWAVFNFSEMVSWVGISQSERGRVSLYFEGTAGDLNNSDIFVNYASNQRISIKQVSSVPSIFKADILYDEDIPLAILKKSSHLVVAFNNERLMGIDVLPERTEGMTKPGSLKNISNVIQEKYVRTYFQFDGKYDLVGYMRPSKSVAALFFRGAKLESVEDDLTYPSSPLRRIRIFDDKKGFVKAVMFFQPEASFSIAQRYPDLIVQTDVITPPPVQEKLVREETGSVGKETALKEESKKEPEKIVGKKLAEATPLSKTIEEKKQQVVPEEKRQIELDRSKKKEEKPKATVESVQKKEQKGEAPERKKALAMKEVKKIEAEPSKIPWDKKVSFNFRSTPIHDALRIVASSYDLNMVITDGVEGSVTMNLKDVTLKQTLDKIIYTNNCEYYEDNGIITVKPAGVVYAGGQVTKVYRLEYADANNIASVVRQIVDNDSMVQVFHPEFLMYEESGKNRQSSNKNAVQGIRRSSTLVVTTSPEKIKQIDRVIAELDKMPTQIMIKSQLVEASPITTNKLGIDWDKTITTMLWDKYPLEGGTYIDYSGVNDKPSKGGKFTLASLTTSKFQAVLDFLKEKTDATLKSNPNIVAMDNEESSISVGTTVPVPKIQRGLGGQGDMVTFDYKEINIQLNVTPHITKDGRITMYVNPVIEEITDWVIYKEHRAPVTSKRSVNSIVTINNGETLAIGGLIKTQKVKTIKKVWFLGSLPLIGKLFQHEKYEEKQTDLIIFITPTII